MLTGSQTPRLGDPPPGLPQRQCRCLQDLSLPILVLASSDQTQSHGEPGAGVGPGQVDIWRDHQGSGCVTSAVAGKVTPDDRTTHREGAISRSFAIKDSLIHLQHARPLDQAKAKLRGSSGPCYSELKPICILWGPIPGVPDDHPDS